jgi:serine/threonine protein kinase/formylglycine-generating enzyme required for sulfatase activity
MSRLLESQCLTDETLAVLIDGGLGEQDLSHVHGHLDKCPACRELVVAVVRGGSREEEGVEPLPASTEPLPLLAAAPGWSPPGEFDEFRLVRPLGRGAMGVVYLAHDRSLDRQVAVKFIASHRPGPKARERFQTEARAIARLQHPNVVTVFRVGEVDDHPYIVSEYLAGESLSALPLPLPWRRVVSMGIGLARGLAAAHRQGVLHRDLKPENVLLTTDGEVKLLDFGLAKLISTDTPVEEGKARSAAGTPRYMAPELFQGAPATPQSDLYSLGLILHKLCTGTLPPSSQHEPPSAQQERLATASDVSPARDEGAPLALSLPGIDLDLALLIERCLRARPEERFASAETLCAALERLHTPDTLSSGNPYRGLAPFEPEHRALFFGRDSDIRAVLERLRRQPLVLIAGDSGAGKSSLCRAGILSRVTQGALDEYRDFSALTLTPGRRPLAALAAVLAPLLGQPEVELGARLAETPQWLGPALRAASHEGRGLLLFIDQLEELITLSEPAEAERFARILAELALPAEGVRLLLTVRGDFLTRVGALPGLGTEIERALYLLRPLTPEGVREAITGPARGRGVVFESEELLQTLIEATTRGAGSLPLLQFTLAELWERRDQARGCIPQAALAELGGVAGALSKHGDAVLARLDRAGQQMARHLFGRLMTTEGTRSTRSEEELGATSEEARAVLRALVSGRLLHTRTVEGQTSYEIAHEALITGWSTMQRWLDEDAGQRALQQRIELARAEWERAGRPVELLWRGRPLEEVRAIEVTALGTREQEFLLASQRHVRRQHQRRWAAALILLLIVGAAYSAPRLQTHLETLRFVRERMEVAQAALARGQELGQRARASRMQALELFNGHAPNDPGMQLNPQELRVRAEAVWDQALAELEQARDAMTRGEGALEDALDRAHDDADVRQRLLEILHARIELAEHFHQQDERARLMQRFERLAAHDARWRDRLAAPAELEIVTEPAGTHVEFARYVSDGKGGLQLQPVTDAGARGPAPLSRVELAAGSYLLRFTKDGFAPVVLPLLLARGQRERVHLALPIAVPDGYVYIPPGCLLVGSSDPEEVRRFLRSAPLHEQCLQQGYLIGQNEVTMGDWLAYLEALPEGSPQRSLLSRLPAQGGLALGLEKRADGRWFFSFRMESGKVLTASAGEPIHYAARTHHRSQDWRRLPLAGVSADDLQGYLGWLDHSGRLPGARLCNELEWIRAARGADGRRYPHGDRLENSDANIDLTYGTQLDARAPDEVGTHPTSASPFGLQDIAGNALELVTPTTLDLGDIVIKGGGWYYGTVGPLIANRQSFKSQYKDARVGVRLCAPAPPQ